MSRPFSKAHFHSPLFEDKEGLSQSEAKNSPRSRRLPSLRHQLLPKTSASNIQMDGSSIQCSKTDTGKAGYEPAKTPPACPRETPSTATGQVHCILCSMRQPRALEGSAGDKWKQSLAARLQPFQMNAKGSVPDREKTPVAWTILAKTKKDDVSDTRVSVPVHAFQRMQDPVLMREFAQFRHQVSLYSSYSVPIECQLIELSHSNANGKL